MKKEVTIQDIQSGTFDIEHIRTFNDIDFVWKQDTQQLINAETGEAVPLNYIYDNIRSCLDHQERLVCKRKKRSHTLMTIRLEEGESTTVQ